MQTIGKALRAVAVFVGVMPFMTTSTALAAILGNEKELAWASRRDLTSQQFSAAFNEYRQRGYMMVDVDAYPFGKEIRYAMIWQENKDGRGWAEFRDMTSDGYHEKWEEYEAKGYRPLDIEAYQGGGKWAGIWVENKEGFAWSSHRGLDDNAYGRLFAEKSAAGFRLVEMEVYGTPRGLRYAAIWYRNTDNRRWTQVRDLTREQYQREVEKRSAEGMRIVDFDSYRTSQGQRYAAIWESSSGDAWQLRTDRTERDFANHWRQYRDGNRSPAQAVRAS